MPQRDSERTKSDLVSQYQLAFQATARCLFLSLCKCGKVQPSSRPTAAGTGMHPASEESWAATFCQDFKATTGAAMASKVHGLVNSVGRSGFLKCPGCVGQWPVAQENWPNNILQLPRQPSAGPSSPPLRRYDSVSSDLGLRAPELSIKFDSYSAHAAACSLSGHSSQLSASTIMEQDVAGPAPYLYSQVEDSLDSDIEDMLQLQVSPVCHMATCWQLE